MEIRWARSATKHRVSKARSRHVIEHCGLWFEVEPPADAPGCGDTRLLYLGADADGAPLEVMAVEARGRLSARHPRHAAPRSVYRAVRGGEEMAPVKATSKRQTKRDRTKTTAARTSSGVKVTRKVADALAKEAERGYDLSAAKRRRVGRPSLGSGGSSPRVTFRAGPDLYRAAQARARREGRTISELAREAFARYIAEQQGKRRSNEP